MNTEYNLVELSRRLENLIRHGVIAEADYTTARVRVTYNTDAQGQPVNTNWLPWLTQRASHDADWWPPEVGEQVLILSPSGDLSQGFVLPAVYQNNHPAPETVATKRRINFADGSFVEYDRAAHKLTVTVNGGDCVLNTTGNLDAAIGGDALINTNGKLDATVGGDANVAATGNVNVDGTAINLNQGTSGGVVCQLHVCALTGSPHPQGSVTVKGGG